MPLKQETMAAVVEECKAHREALVMWQKQLQIALATGNHEALRQTAMQFANTGLPPYHQTYAQEMHIKATWKSNAKKRRYIQGQRLIAEERKQAAQDYADTRARLGLPPRPTYEPPALQDRPGRLLQTPQSAPEACPAPQPRPETQPKRLDLGDGREAMLDWDDPACQALDQDAPLDFGPLAGEEGQTSKGPLEGPRKATGEQS